MIEAFDALGRPIVLGQTYGYSRSDGGWSHVTVGKAANISPKGNVRLVECTVKRWLYGQDTDHRADEVPADVSIRSSMIFPVETLK